MPTVPDSTLSWLANTLRSHYHDPNRTYADIVNVLSQYNTVEAESAEYTYENGAFALLIKLQGTIPVNFRGTVYHFPIAVWVPQDYPLSSPMVYVTPTRDMAVRPGQHVSVEGKVYHPYLARWAGDVHRSTLSAFLSILVDIFGREPPVEARQQHQRPQRDYRPADSSRDPRQQGQQQLYQQQQFQQHRTSQYYQDEGRQAIGSPDNAQRPPSLPPKSATPAQSQRYDHSSIAHDPRSSIAPGGPPLPPKPGGLQSEGNPASPSSSQRLSEAEWTARGPPLPPLPPDLNRRDSYSARPGSLPQGHPQQYTSMHRPVQYAPQQQPPHPRPISQHYSPPVQQDPRSVTQPTPYTQHSNQAHYQQREHPQQTQHQQHYQQRQEQILQQPQYSIPRPPTQTLPPSQQAAQQRQPPPKQPPPDLLTSPLDLPLPTVSPAAPPPIPPNPEKDALLSAIATHLHTQLLAALAQNEAALPALAAQRDAMLTAQRTLDAELAQLAQLSGTLDSNEAILRTALADADAQIARLEQRRRSLSPTPGTSGKGAGGLPSVDEILTAPTIASEQLYNLVAEERAIVDALFALQRAFDAGRVSGDVFVRTTRTLSRERFLKLVLIGKVARGLGLDVRGMRVTP